MIPRGYNLKQTTRVVKNRGIGIGVISDIPKATCEVNVLSKSQRPRMCCTMQHTWLGTCKDMTR